MEISKESQKFLENLRVYLFSSGKKEQEINEVIEELEDHLYEAEKNGKNIDDIIGKTPKEYMDQVADEMSFDMKGLIKYIPIIMIGAFAFILAGKAVRGPLEFSIFELAGYPLIFLISVLQTALVFRYISSRNLSKVTEWTLLWIIGLVPVLLFLLQIYLDRTINTPAMEFGPAGNFIAIGIAAIIFISVAVWSKSYTFLILPILLYGPEAFLNQTDLPDETKAIWNIVILFSAMGIYLLISWYSVRKNGEQAQD